MRAKTILLTISAVVLFLQSCGKPSLTDTREFELYYMGVSGLHPGEQITLSPSYIGSAPENFRITRITRDGEIHYNPKLDGELSDQSTFWVDPGTGSFVLQKSTALKAGKYIVSISCTSGGKTYQYPEAITINIVKQQ